MAPEPELVRQLPGHPTLMDEFGNPPDGSPLITGGCPAGRRPMLRGLVQEDHRVEVFRTGYTEDIRVRMSHARGW